MTASDSLLHYCSGGLDRTTHSERSPKVASLLYVYFLFASAGPRGILSFTLGSPRPAVRLNQTAHSRRAQLEAEMSPRISFTSSEPVPSLLHWGTGFMKEAQL